MCRETEKPSNDFNNFLCFSKYDVGDVGLVTFCIRIKKFGVDPQLEKL